VLGPPHAAPPEAPAAPHAGNDTLAGARKAAPGARRGCGFKVVVACGADADCGLAGATHAPPPPPSPAAAASALGYLSVLRRAAPRAFPEHRGRV